MQINELKYEFGKNDSFPGIWVFEGENGSKKAVKWFTAVIFTMVVSFHMCLLNLYCLVLYTHFALWH